MSKILYSAVDRRGRERNGYIDAATNEAALQELTAAGYSQVRFHDDGSASFPRDWLKHAKQADLEAIAEIELQSRQFSGFGPFLLSAINTNKWPCLIGLGLFFWGLIQQSVLWMSIGGVCGLTIPLLSAWNYRVVKRFDDLLIAFGEGRWQESRRLIRSLRRHYRGSEMAFELDVRDAIANSENASLEDTIASLEPWMKKLEDISPGLYALRVASVYAHYDRYDCVLELLREAYRKSPASPVMALDLALAEIKLGDADKAVQLIESLDQQTLPSIAPPFIDWVRALIQQSKGKADTERYYQKAVSGMLDLGTGATFLQPMALCVGDFAVYCLENECMPRPVESMLATLWPVIRAHGQKTVIGKLIRAYPKLATE